MTNLEKFNALENSRSKELTMKHARLMEKIEHLPLGIKLCPEIIKEKATLEGELQSILEDNLIGTVIPVRPKLAEILSHPKAIKKKSTAPLIRFNFEVFSGINTRIGRFGIDATSKDEAWGKARKKASKYQGQSSLKIS